MNLEIVQDRSDFPKIPKILAVAAGKGGVGKSTVSVNLALSLKKKGLKVGLLDADVYGPSIEQMLPSGMEPVESLENPERLMPALSFGIPFISVAHFRKRAAIVRAPIANQIIEQFLHTVDWSDLDYLIADFPPGTGDIQLSLMQKAPLFASIVVTTPQIVATLDVRKAVELFKQMQIPVMGVVENMSFLSVGSETLFPFGKGGGEEIAQDFSIPLLASLPIDPTISEAADRGVPLGDTYPQSPGALAFDTLAEKVFVKLASMQVPNIEVRQKDPHSIEVKKNEKWHSLSLHQLQLHCPCARCAKGKKSEESVSLLEFSPVGSYAIRVRFSSGCSQGIYPYTLLEKLTCV